ncbi:MAG TPA: EAL domain-containing protein [Steroidobacteraceae bacterium]|nr:EAL domain-containing protein [Steroidobacteraceae bacterium]
MPAVVDLEEIRQAYDKREFFLVYLPIVSLFDGRCVGAEALIRWRRGEEVVVDACEFIPSTEGTPLSGLITYWVIDTVAAEIGAWLVHNPDAHISINVPPEILGRGGLEYAAVKSGLRSRVRQLILEVTERGVPDQLGIEALNSIPSTGARVALDDVTLSGANLALLTRCKFDIVKVERTLIAQLAPGDAQPTWLAGLKTLLQTATSLQVIAEGVETAHQAEVLRTAGIQMAQGHHFSAPLPAAAYKRYYAATRGNPQ